MSLMDLEAKRQAVLLSMKSKRASKSVTPQPPEPQGREEAPAQCQQGPMSSETKQMLCKALEDLRSYGLSLDEIVARAKVRREFVAELYREMKWPVAEIIPQAVVEASVESRVVPSGEASREASVVPRMDRQQRRWDYYSNSNIISNNRVPMSENKPEWLSDLVIDLESSEEESDDEAHSPVKKRQLSVDDNRDSEELKLLTGKLNKWEEEHRDIDAEISSCQARMEGLEQELRTTRERMKRLEDERRVRDALREEVAVEKNKMMKEQAEKEQEQASNAYDETIHKIPKVIFYSKHPTRVS